MGSNCDQRYEDTTFAKRAKDRAHFVGLVLIDEALLLLLALVLSCALAAGFYCLGLVVPSFTKPYLLDRTKTAEAFVFYSVLAAFVAHVLSFRSDDGSTSLRRKFIDVGVGIAFFAVIKLLPSIFLMCPIVVIAAVVGLAIAFARLMYPKMGNRAFGKFLCAAKACLASAVCVAGLALVLVATCLVSGVAISSGNVGESVSEAESAGSIANSQLIRDILSDDWKLYPMSTKTSRLQALVHQQSEYLSIDEPKVELVFCSEGKSSAYRPSRNTIEVNALGAMANTGQSSLENVFYEVMSAYQCRVAREGINDSDPIQFNESELEEIRSGVEKLYETDTTDSARDFLDGEAIYWNSLSYEFEQTDACLKENGMERVVR